MAESPAVRRIVNIFEFLARHPGKRYTSSELARELRISHSTIQTFLTPLEELGYTTRDPTSRRYGLGPAVIPLGEMGQRAKPAARAATAVGEKLAEKLRRDLVITAATKDDLLVLYQFPQLAGRASSMIPGRRIPLRPPLALAFMAWADHSVVESYLERGGVESDAQLRDSYLDLLKQIRRFGYVVTKEIADIDPQPIVEAYEQGYDSPGYDGSSAFEISKLGASLAHADYMRAEVRGTESQAIRSISVPIFGADGRPELAFTVLLSGDRLDGSEVREIADSVLRAAAEVMDASGGQPPSSDEFSDGL
jgi:DNA-binding IclR family transcriptional regulator